jgi:nucleoside-diphosphate-sugar epimerase
VNVMVLGATGFIGPPLVRRLLSRGHAVVAVSRNPDPGEAGATPLALDRSDPAAVARAAEAHRTEAVIDLLAMTLAATAPLLEALAGRVGRYVLASSGDVYRQYGAIHRLEPEPQPSALLAEDAPLRTRLHPYRSEPRRPADDPAAWMDDYDKIPIERAAAGHPGLPAVIVRLPMIYGPGDRYGRFSWAIGPMLAGAPTIEVDREWAAWRSSYGFVDDVAAGLALAATHEAAAGVYNLGPKAAGDHLAWADRFAAALGWAGELRAVARDAVAEPLRARLSALDLTLPLATDTARIRGELGYREVTDPEAALDRTIAAL